MIERLKNTILPDNTKVVPLPFDPGSYLRVKKILDSISSLEENTLSSMNREVKERFRHRHFAFEKTLKSNLNTILKKYSVEVLYNGEQALLAGSYFTKEYSIESAALFNPSMVLHPDQSGLKNDEVRVIISLRATGEGHISSITFKTGIINQEGKISFTKHSEPLVISGQYVTTSDSNDRYTIAFPEETVLDQRVIFPYLDNECCGMEDLRMVHFRDVDEDFYAGTYTAYNGKTFTTHLLRTDNFETFEITPLKGKAIKDKGMALFPEKINGKYAMISRQGGRDISIMYSDSLFQWDESETIRKPDALWNLIQLGNCGSPIKTEDGWLLFTHGVGPFRRYAIGAMLLNTDNPSEIIAASKTPVLEPAESEREGYVPNVLYSCGGIAVRKNIILPYAMSDTQSGVCKIDTTLLVNALKKDSNEKI